MLLPFKSLPVSSIRGIIHIGAHEAEELDDYVRCGIVNVLWVEASPERCDRLKKLISPYPRMLLGEFAAAAASGETGILHIASNTQSSSLLPLGTHADSYPDIKYIDNVHVKLLRVDDWIDELCLDRGQYNFVNLDIQGYEVNALRGMARQLMHVDYIYVEVNFSEVYIGCARINDLDDYLGGFGFRRVATVDTRAGWGDALYSRKLIGWLRVRFLLRKIFVCCVSFAKRAVLL